MRIFEDRSGLVDGAAVARHRRAVAALFDGYDDRLFVVVDPGRALVGEHATRLAGLAKGLEKDLLIALRIGVEGRPAAGEVAWGLPVAVEYAPRVRVPRSRGLDRWLNPEGARTGARAAALDRRLSVSGLRAQIRRRPAAEEVRGATVHLAHAAWVTVDGRSGVLPPFPMPVGVRPAPGRDGSVGQGCHPVLPSSAPRRVTAALAALASAGRPARLVVDATAADRRVVDEWAWRIAEGERGVAGLMLDADGSGVDRAEGVLRVLAAAVRERRHG
ncbi:hypothetical protein Lfu02_54170 [Longispora fulva]|uniref:Uncharacterized protein n=1 Tax=Longispora fulva TaxID=619741 RepID=A0A8J7KK34_9ACTN|nr:hypothetical protein [Longispora fulva]MBG6137599.1 hypothetical protein [Longispora fulva]GIG61045.1 hypothetical protein Lfu02_54170 [Longispora fulva]